MDEVALREVRTWFTAEEGARLLGTTPGAMRRMIDQTRLGEDGGDGGRGHAFSPSTRAARDVDGWW